MNVTTGFHTQNKKGESVFCVRVPMLTMNLG